MRIQIEPTDKIVTLDGIQCRLWNGVTEDGTHVFLLVHRIGVHVDEDATKFTQALKEMDQPSTIVVKDVPD